MQVTELAAKIFGLVEGFDIGYTVAHIKPKSLTRKFAIILYTDSQSLYVPCILLAQTTE